MGYFWSYPTVCVCVCVCATNSAETVESTRKEKILQTCLNKDRLDKKKEEGEGDYLHINVRSFNPHHNRTLQTDVIITIPRSPPSTSQPSSRFQPTDAFKKNHTTESVQVTLTPAPPSFRVRAPTGVGGWLQL